MRITQIKMMCNLIISFFFYVVNTHMQNKKHRLSLARKAVLEFLNIVVRFSLCPCIQEAL